MKEIIAIVNRRGGVGKTVTAHAIGSGLSLRGHKVLFIDLDSQCNLTFDLGVNKPALSSMEVLTDACSISDALQHCSHGDLVPASTALALADVNITETGKEYRLAEAIEPIKKDYDYIVIDTPPALGILTVNALTAANSLIIPAQAEIHSIQGIGHLQETINAVKKYTNKALKVRGILITRYNARSILSQDMRSNLEAAAKLLDSTVYETPIRECTAIKEAQASQQSIFQYAPKSNAVADYNDLLDAIEK